MASTKTIFIFGREWVVPEEAPEQSVVYLLSRTDFGEYSPGGCWTWIGKAGTAGYSQACLYGKSGTAHRAMYHMLVGPVPSWLDLHHLCENRPCVNPDHLRPLTAAQHREVTPQAATHYFKTRTHCKNGHELIPENFVTSGRNGLRRCKICVREWANRKNARLREERGPKAPQTHCKHGHEFTEENTYIYKGTRFCRTCHNIRSTDWYGEHRKADAENVANGELPKEALHVDQRGKTHCKRGHLLPLEPGNRPSMPTRRVCRECALLRSQLDYYRKVGNAEKVADIEAKLALPAPS